MKRGGDKLLRRRIGQQVPGHLFDGEAVEGEVVIDRADDPVAKLPDGPRLILRVAIGIGVTSPVEPVDGLPLTVMR